MLSTKSNRLICGVSPAARGLIAVLVLAPTTSCWLGDSALGPEGRVAQLTLVTAFSTHELGAPAAVGPVDEIERLGFIVRRLDGSLVVADTVQVDVESGRVEHTIGVTFTPPTETFTVEVVLLDSNGDELFRGGPVEYTISESDGENPSPLQVTVVLSGGDITIIIANAIASMEDALFIGLNAEELSQLDDFSFAESNALFLNALALSPSDATALFGAAVTGIFLLEDNSRLRALADEVEAWAEDDSTASPVAMLLGPAMTAIGDPMTLPLGFSTATIEQVAHSDRRLRARMSRLRRSQDKNTAQLGSSFRGAAEDERVLCPRRDPIHQSQGGRESRHGKERGRVDPEM